jgi:glycosyltransferase involved in cell wall biosynthesis
MTRDPLRVLVVTAGRAHEVTTPLRRTDCEVGTVGMDGSAGFLARNFEVVRRTWRATRQDDPDVVLIDVSALLGFLAAFVAVLAGSPVVCRFKGDNRRTLLERYEFHRDGLTKLLTLGLSLALNRATYALACGHVVVSTELKRVVVDRLGCDPDRVRVIHVPIDPGHFEETTTGRACDEAVAVGDGERDHNRPDIDADTLILTVTNLRYRGKLRGAETALDGIVPVLVANDDVAYIVLGAGHYYERFRSYVDRAVDEPSVRERIYVPGFLENIVDLYERADIMVYISHIDGYPNAVLEAQLAEVPIIANDAHGMSEQITHRETGYLLTDPTPKSVTDWVDHLLDRPDERARVGAAAHRRVVTENDPVTIGRDLESALRAILEAAS